MIGRQRPAGAISLAQTAGADQRGRPAAVGISHPELFSMLYLLGIVNALAPAVFPALRSDDPFQALAAVLDIVTLAAVAAGIHLLWQMPATAVRRTDWAVAATIVPLLLVPHRAGSWLAVTGLALYTIWRDRRSIPAVASGSIFLALAASNFWGQILVQAFSSTLLALDAALTAAMLEVLGSGEVERVGNLIISGQMTILVLVGCASLPLLLHGLLLWIVIARLLRPEWRLVDLFALLAVGGVVLMANTLRLALMGLSAHSYQWVHGPAGTNAFNIGLLLVIAAIALCSAGAAAPARHR
jgi:hypothetical protein